jgi:hypothetical protein
VQTKVDQFLAALETGLARVTEGNSIANLLDQCMYTGLSLGRVGLDLRGLIAPIFTRRVHSLFEGSLKAAQSQFVVALAAHKFTRSVAAAASRRSVMTPLPLDASVRLSSTAAATLSPSFRLLDHPLLTNLANGIIEALNELRQCAPLCLKRRLTESLDAMLRGVVAHVLARASTADPADHQSVEVFCEVVCDDLVPHITKCFDAIWRSPKLLLIAADITSPIEHLCKRPPPPPPPPPQETKELPEAPDQPSAPDVPSPATPPQRS